MHCANTGQQDRLAAQSKAIAAAPANVAALLRPPTTPEQLHRSFLSSQPSRAPCEPAALLCEPPCTYLPHAPPPTAALLQSPRYSADMRLQMKTAELRSATPWPSAAPLARPPPPAAPAATCRRPAVTAAAPGSSSSSGGSGGASASARLARSPAPAALQASARCVAAAGAAAAHPSPAFTSASERDLDLPAPGFDSIPDALAAMAAGELVVVLDDEDRENEGDLICAADKLTPQTMAFMVNHTSGVICVGMEGRDLDRLRIPLMVSSAENEEALYTAFTITVDLRHGTTTGISAADRTATLRALADPQAKPEDFKRPGHIFPLRAREVRWLSGGVGGSGEAWL